MKGQFTAQHSNGKFIELQWEDNMRMGGDYRTNIVEWHRSYSMYRYENIPDELLGAYYLECDRGPERDNEWTKAGKGLPPGETAVHALAAGVAYVVAETGVLGDADPFGIFDGGFSLDGWEKLEVGPRNSAMFNFKVGENLPDPKTKLHGPWAMFEVGGQARFSWRKTCFDSDQDEKTYSSTYLSVWRKTVSQGEKITLKNTEFWTGGIAFQPAGPGLLQASTQESSCASLTLQKIPSLMEKKTLQVADNPVTDRHVWYAASVAAGKQAVVYNSGDPKNPRPILKLLNDDDEIVKTVVINTAGREEMQIKCNVGFLGGDPFYGHYGFCYCAPDDGATPFTCEYDAMCKCRGTVWYGKKYANGKPGSGAISTWEQVKASNTVTKKLTAEDSIKCNVGHKYFGSDPTYGWYGHCYCDPSDGASPFICAEYDDKCTCKGTAYYGKRFANGKPGSGAISTFEQLKAA